jgi:hypothetical protein
MEDLMATQSNVLPWSYSGIKLFKTCPRKFFAEKVEKSVPYEESPAAALGNFVHKMLELHVCTGTPLPEKLPNGAPFPKLGPMVEALKALPGEPLCERKFGVTVHGRPCEFFDKRHVWFRGVVDFMKVHEDKAWIVDYKTGSSKYPDKDQLELMALAVLAHFDQVQTVHGALLFINEATIVKSVLKRKDADEKWKKWVQDAEVLKQTADAGIWAPKPCGLCREWCRVTQCEYNGV